MLNTKFTRWLPILASSLLLNVAVAQTAEPAQSSPLPGSSAGSVLASLQQDSNFLQVDQAFQFDFVQQKDQLQLSWHIADGYYLYRDRIKLAGVAVSFSHPAYPTGEPHEDEYFGKMEVYRQSLQLTVPLSDIDKDAVLKVRYQGCAEAGLCYPPVTKEVPLSQLTAQQSTAEAVAAGLSSTATSANNEAATTPSPTDNAGQAPISVQDQLLTKLQQQQGIAVLAIFFVLGLGLAFTPCVFPMYPILTSIIAGQGQQLSTKRAFALSMSYVQGMAITYSLLGLVVASMGVKFQSYFQHPAVLWGISGLLIVLALSMFGVINLQPPSSWSEKVSNASNAQQGGTIKGALVMGMLSGLVASPCTTAPLTAVLLYIAQSGDLVFGMLVLYILSLGMGLPMLLLGSSGGKWLPRPGAWMDMVKHTFGFLLLSVPLMLLSRVISSELLVILSSVLALGFAAFMYHTGQTLLQSAKAKTISWLVASIVLIATVQFNSEFWRPAPATSAAAAVQASTTFKRISSLQELDAELASAKAANQFVMLDLFAEWCVACKEFEHITFADPQAKTEMAKFRLLQIDVTAATEQDQQLLEKFQVLGLPTILFFAPNSGELTQSRITGFMPANEFVAHLQKIQQSK